jgi:hypothetical protein
MESLEQQAVQQYIANCQTKKENPEPIGKTLLHVNRFGFGSIVQLFGKNGKALGQFKFSEEKTATSKKQNPIASSKPAFAIQQTVSSISATGDPKNGKKTVLPVAITSPVKQPSVSSKKPFDGFTAGEKEVVKNIPFAEDNKAESDFAGFSSWEKEYIHEQFEDTSKDPEDPIYNKSKGFSKAEAKLIRNL